VGAADLRKRSGRSKGKRDHQSDCGEFHPDCSFAGALRRPAISSVDADFPQTRTRAQAQSSLARTVVMMALLGDQPLPLAGAT
jgi:hypothetical protein